MPTVTIALPACRTRVAPPAAAAATAGCARRRRRRAASRRPARPRPTSSGRSTRGRRAMTLRAARIERASRRNRVEPRHRSVDLRRGDRATRRSTESSPSALPCTGAADRGSRPRTGPISAMRPAYITATRSAVSAITPMSWVISITAVPCSRHSVLDQADDLGLDRHVERGGRLVGDDQSGLGGERQRDHDPLAHAARRIDGGSGRCVLRPPVCRSP